MAGRNAQQSRILHSAGGSTGTFVELEAVTSIDGPTGTANNIDVTDLRSTGKENVPGLADYGTVTLQGNWIGGTVQQALYTMFSNNSDPESFKVAMPTSSAGTTFDVFAFDASVSAFSLGAKVDDKQTCNITLKVSGAVILSPNVASGSLA
jgi:hypothetical protein